MCLRFKLGRNRTTTTTNKTQVLLLISEYDDAMSSMLKGARKAGVAVTGTALVAVGAVLNASTDPRGDTTGRGGDGNARDGI